MVFDKVLTKDFRHGERAPHQAVVARGGGHQRAGAGHQAAQRRGVAGQDGRVQGADRGPARGHRRRRRAEGSRARGAGRDSARGLCGGARGRLARGADAPLRRAVDRRHGAAPGQDRRDEDRRRQNAGGHAGLLSERAGRPRRARGHGERLPGQARRRVDGQDLRVPGPHRGRHRPRPGRRASAAQPTPPTSPTAPTTSSASTTCATT